ncbi:MAG: hypothetical protein U0235_18685 [Polyangiaceae bacterium]
MKSELPAAATAATGPSCTFCAPRASPVNASKSCTHPSLRPATNGESFAANDETTARARTTNDLLRGDVDDHEPLAEGERHAISVERRERQPDAGSGTPSFNVPVTVLELRREEISPSARIPTTVRPASATATNAPSIVHRHVSEKVQSSSPPARATASCSPAAAKPTTALAPSA